MHVAIDARMYGTKQRGIGRYLVKLIENLEKVDSKNEYTIFLRKENFEEYQPNNPNFKKTLWDTPWYGMREQFPRSTFYVLRSTLFHFPHWNVPLLFHKPFVVTIHDLELFSSNRTRESSTRGRITYWFKFQAFKIIFRHAVLAARAIIVPSNVVREQLLDLYPQVRRKVQVIYEAPTIDANSYQLAASAPPKAAQISNSQYALYVGAAYPHKNLPRLLEAWKIVHAKLPEYKLVLVGREDWFWKKLKRGSEKSSVLFYGEATDKELATLYKNAALLIQPSLEEGFSLPPLEALSFGTPVAVSDIPVHREILGDATTYFNPRNVQAIAKTLAQTMQTPVTSPLPRHYSWQKHAEQTLKLYETTKLG